MLVQHRLKWIKGKEYILRDAPALVVAIGSKKDIHRTHDSGHSCLSYAELYAQH